MMKMIRVEWLKLKYYRPFWILLAMYSLMTLLVACGGMAFLTWLKNEGADIKGYNPTDLPIYDFPDIWQNLTFLVSFFKIILAFIVIMSVNNEFNFRIVRQNIIDGLDKKDWLLSKVTLIASISTYATILVFLSGLIMGLIYSHPDARPLFWVNTHFLIVYFFDLFIFLCFAMMLSLLIRKGPLVIVGLFMYTLAFEPIAAALILYYPNFPESLRFLADLLPVQALRNLTPFPFKRFMFYEVSDVVPFISAIIATVWGVFYLGMSYWILKRKDL